MKKGIEAALGVVITLVVLVIIAVAVVTVATGSTSKTKQQSETQISTAGCQLAVKSYCLSHDTETNKAISGISGCAGTAGTVDCTTGKIT